MNKTNNRPGGMAIKNKFAPAVCPKCNKPFPWQTPWHEFLGHLGLHGLADKYFDGSLALAQEHLRKNGLARLDPAPWNGAWRAYRKLPPPKQKGRDSGQSRPQSLLAMLPHPKDEQS